MRKIYQSDPVGFGLTPRPLELGGKEIVFVQMSGDEWRDLRNLCMAPAEDDWKEFPFQRATYRVRQILGNMQMLLGHLERFEKEMDIDDFKARISKGSVPESPPSV